MHETARCFGYPSDSTRAARERAREATCGYCLRWTGQAQPGRHRVADRQRRAAAPVSGTPGRARPVSRPGTTADALSAKLASSSSRPHWGPVMHYSCSCRQSRWARRGRATNQPASGLLTAQPASGLPTTQPASTIGRRCRRRAVPGHHRLGCCRPGGRAVPGLGAPDLR